MQLELDFQPQLDITTLTRIGIVIKHQSGIPLIQLAVPPCICSWVALVPLLLSGWAEAEINREASNFKQRLRRSDCKYRNDTEQSTRQIGKDPPIHFSDYLSSSEASSSVTSPWRCTYIMRMLIFNFFFSHSNIIQRHKKELYINLF